MWYKYILSTVTYSMETKVVRQNMNSNWSVQYVIMKND